MSDGVLNGSQLEDMTYDEYMSIFNMPAAQITQKLHDAACAVFVLECKPILECTTQEVQERINARKGLLNMLVVCAQRDKKSLHDIIESANDDEREEIRKRDRSYKPVVRESDDKPKVKKVSQTQEEKMRSTLKSLGMDEEQIDKYIIEKRKK